MTSRPPSATPLPNALPIPVLRRSTHVWNGLDLLSSPAPVPRGTTPDVTDAEYAHTQELMNMLDEEIELAGTKPEQAEQAEQREQPALLPVRVPLQQLMPVAYKSR